MVALFFFSFIYLLLFFFNRILIGKVEELEERRKEARKEEEEGLMGVYMEGRLCTPLTNTTIQPPIYPPTKGMTI